MGYYTSYTLRIDNADLDEVMHRNIIDEIIELYGGSPFDDDCKWYHHDNHMKKISRKWPDLLFELHGIGEESPDIWYTYYKDGKMQHCKGTITFDKYDPEKLI